MTSTLKNRWWLSAQIVTTTPLRIATGELMVGTERDSAFAKDSQIPLLEREAKFSAVALDAAGKPWIPGASLRGALRAWLESNSAKDTHDTLDLLFGSAPGVEEGLRAGSLICFGGRFLAQPPADSTWGKTLRESSHWDSSRGTTLETGVAIERAFGVAIARKLFNREVVPAGSVFALALEVSGAEAQDIAVLVSALQALGKGDIPLGGDTGDGKGRFSLSGLSVRCADAAVQTAWISRRLAGSKQVLEECAVAWDILAIPREPVQAATLGIDLDFESLFCVSDPSRVLKEARDGREKTTALMPRVDEHGRPLLPAASFRGVLRARLERIARTLKIQVCGEDPDKECIKPRSLRDVPRLCPVCALMGSTGWRAPLDMADFQEKGHKSQSHAQEFVAIDRFTGGGVEGAKFNASAFYRPTLSGSIRLDLSRLQKSGKAETALALLGLALRDLAEGDLRFGMGAAKGYGHVLAARLQPSVDWSAAVSIAKLPELVGAPAPDFKSSVPNPEYAAPKPPTGKAKADEFLNPYQFAPLPTGKAESGAGWKSLESMEADGLGTASHARFSNQAAGEPVYSGRIICKLTAETQMFVGGKRHPGAPAVAEHFMLEPGKPAIPASSLRGLLSSLVETATGSALRTLEDRGLSYRKDAKDALSAMGMVVEQEGKHWLLPITLPTKVRAGNHWENPPEGEYPEMDNDAGSPAALKIYISHAAGNASYSPDESGKMNCRYVELSGDLRWNNGRFSNEDNLRFPSKDEKKTFVIGQKGNHRTTLPFYSLRLAGAERAGDTRCLVRVMHAAGRDFPDKATHDLLLPLNEEWEAEGQIYPIPNHVIERFHQLADERTAESIRKEGEGADDSVLLPYHPVGTKRNLDSRVFKRNLRLKEGDLVYFHLEKNNSVKEISFSAIWRGRVENKETKEPATVRRFFEKLNPELLPFSSKRHAISPAELIFGYAADDKKQEKSDTWGGAYAGRVFPGDGLSKNAPQSEEVLLKILDAPKLPCPVMYFKRRNNGSGAIAKNKLNPDEHEIQGRKYYLHQAKSDTPPWVSGDQVNGLRQKVKIKPVAADAEFVFHMDFENLSAWELGALCYALRPEEAFRHKLGMGKPLGLGTVRIDPLGVFLVDRPSRYAEPVTTARYHKVWLADGAQKVLENWQDRYPREVAAGKHAANVPAKLAPNFDGLRERFRAGMDGKIRRALEVLGNPAFVGQTPVHYPWAQAQEGESELFRWFVNNDKAAGVPSHQYLRALDDSGLPVLRKNWLFHFFLGGQDWEMVSIAKLLKAQGVRFKDSKLAWGAQASFYRTDIAAALERGETPVLVELQPDLAPELAARCRWIDHHGEAAGADKPGALRQTFDLLELPAARWSREMALAQANDIGHIEGLLAMRASPAEVRDTRRADREAQGVTAQEEAEGRAALACGRPMVGYFRVELPNERSSLLGDLSHPALGGKPVGDMLVISPKNLAWYGRGEVVQALAAQFGGWWGGALPQRGYWERRRQGVDLQAVEALLARLAR